MTTQCYLCHLKRNIDLARSLGDEETAAAFARELMQKYVSAPSGVSAPWFGPHVTQLLQKYYGVSPDRFRQEKRDSNAYILQRLPHIQKTVRSAEDPVFAALQFAILGNYIDFSALRGEVSFDVLDEMLKKARELPIPQDTYRQFCAELSSGRRLLYLTDNAGEIGFDRILAEELHRRYPHVDITFCVRGGPAQNDATREDAAAVGIPFPVIDNGNTIAGTQIEALSHEAFQALEAADVILAKGQGNTETLLGCGYNIYYAFLIKCARFMEQFQKEKLTPMFLREKA